MEKLKVKHDHTLTDILKVGIFAIILMAPFYAIACECMFAVFNKNSVGAYGGANEECFYLALSHLASSTYFNWTLNTGLGTVYQTMLNNLNFSNAQPLVIVLTWLTLCTIVYVIIDIVLSCFKMITHLVNAK